jgi:NAD(P)-dependent dehydrogenase (short-subunit alcohol dehydrogenase family)/acyl carrier protein
MNLDSDLGIDSIKRVEILSAFQERRPDAPAVTPEDMGSIHTLRDIVDFLARRSGKTVAVPTPEPASAPAAGGDTDTDMTGALLEAVSEKTGYPPEMLELDMNLDSDLGIDSIKRVEILSAFQEKRPDAPAVTPEDMGSIHTLRDIVDFLARRSGKAVAVPTPKPASAPADPSIDQPSRSDGGSATTGVERLLPILTEISGTRRELEIPEGREMVIVGDGSSLPERISVLLNERNVANRVVDLDEDPPVANAGGLLLISPEDPADDFIDRAFQVIRRSGGPLMEAAGEGDALLATVSRLDGSFGFTGDFTSPLSGGLAGIVKTAALEWPEVGCKSIDIAAAHPEEQARLITEEVLLEGPVEVGLTAAGAATIELRSESFKGESRKDRLGPGDLVVASGGARGVTAEVLIALAERHRPTFLLLGRTPLPDREEADFAGIDDATGLKRAIIASADGKLSPKEVEAKCHSLLAAREIRENIGRLRKAGSQAVYRPVDTRNATAVAAAVAGARSTFGPVRGIVHGAGVLADRLIADKTAEDFARVFATKVAGLKALLQACEDDPLTMAVFFSSTTARFGRRGQADYAAANEVLNKAARQLSRKRPGCRVLSINWGPWDGGMVTSGLKELFAEEGVAVIPLRAGAAYALDEISEADDGPVETVILGEGTSQEVATPASPAAPGNPSAGHQVFERVISLEECPILSSHVFGGRAVVPLALIAEWLAHASMHDNIGLHFAGFDDLQTFRALAVDKEEVLTIQAFAGPPRWSGNSAVVSCEIRGGDSLFARADILLAETLGDGETSSVPRPTGLCTETAVYEAGLFHGPDLQGITEAIACDRGGAVARCRSAPPPSAWIKSPLRSNWLSDPLLIDCAFQLMIVWSFGEYGSGSLPTRVGRYRQFVPRFPAEGCELVVRVERSTSSSAAADVEFLDDSGKLLAVMRGSESVIDKLLNEKFRQTAL